MTTGLSVVQPESVADAVEWVNREPTARFVAGGTALQLEWAKGLAVPKLLIALGKIDGLSGVTLSGDSVRIGALAPLGDLERNAALASAAPLLASAIGNVAGPSVRNLATIGGNIAGRTGCLIPALLALDAEVEGASATGPWRVTLHDWLCQPPALGAVIEAIHLPSATGELRWTQRKIGLRAAFTPSVVGVAGLIRYEARRIVSARLAVGGGIVPPTRLVLAEEVLLGQNLDAVDWPDLRAHIATEITAPDDAFRTGRYRRLVAANALIAGLGGMQQGRSQRRAVAASATIPPGEIELGHEAQQSRWHIRPDGPTKIAGSFAYLTDYRMPDMLVGRILRAGVPHARIISIDTSRAESLPGVMAVVTYRDVPGQNGFGIVVQDQPALCHDKVRYIGDAVAAVAAIDADIADAALRLIDVAYEELPIVSSPEQALEVDAPQLHASGNLQRQIDYARGDIEAGFAASAHILEETYVTPRQMHGFMETEGGWAMVQPDGSLAMHAGGQHASRDRLQLSRILAIDESRIRVVTSPTGGAFGGKDELTVQPALALLALKSGGPVRLKLSRAESVMAGTKRHPMVIRMRTGCDAEGRILAQEVDLLADAGAYASLGPGVLETALEHAAGVYGIDNVKTRGRLVYTNNGVCGAFRGFGANQMNYAVECQMDRLAKLCDVSPLEIRRRNLKRAGDGGYFGQQLAPSDRLAEMLKAAETCPLWQTDRGLSSKGDDIVGVGMAMNYHGNGLGSRVPDPAGGRLRLAPDGKIEAVFTLDEMGQGLLTSIVATASAELGCARDDIRPVTGDSAAGPDSGSTAAARSSFVVWQTIRLAAPGFAEKLCREAASRLGCHAETLKLAPGGIVDRRSNSDDILIRYTELAHRLDEESLPTIDIRFDYPITNYTAGNARFLFVSGVCIARVAVDRVTGQVRVLDLDQHSAAGPVLDIAAYLGQMEGGAVQGIGATLTEDALIHDGAYLTANLDTYMMPGIADAPQRMAVYALEDLDANDPYGPRGVGELGIGAVTPAIANAVFDAIGLCPTVTPIQPELVLQALDAVR